MEEPASVAPNRRKTSRAPVYRLQSEPSPALHLPLSTLLRSLLEATNSALSKFVEDQTVHGFLPVPGCRHRRYYRTSSSSFPGPYMVPPGLAFITLDKVSESQKRSVSLSHSQVSFLETMISSVCEVTSWLDWSSLYLAAPVPNPFLGSVTCLLEVLVGAVRTQWAFSQDIFHWLRYYTTGGIQGWWWTPTCGSCLWPFLPLPLLYLRLPSDWPLSPEWVCSADSIQDGDSCLHISVLQRGGFPSFNRSEERIFPDTCSSVVEKAIEVPVGGASLSVQSPMLQVVDCLSGLHSGVCSGICVGALPQDSSSRVPGLLVGPRLFRDGGQKERPGSAFALSLPQDSDKRGEFRSRPLADCKLPQHDHRYRGRQDFYVPFVGQEISVGGRVVLYYVRSPRSALAGGLGTPGFPGEIFSSQSPLNALSAVAFEDALVSRADPPSLPVPLYREVREDFVLVDGEKPSSQGGSIWDTCSGSTPVLGHVSVRVWCTPLRSCRVWGVVGVGEVAAHQSSQNEGSVSGIAIISGVGRRSPCDSDVWQLDSCGLRQQAGRDGLLFPLLVGQPSCEVDGESRCPPRCEVSTRAVQCSGRSPRPLGSGYRDQVVSPPADGERSASALGLIINQFVRDESQREAAPILFPCPGSPGGLWGCVSSSLGQPRPVRVSTLSSGRKSGGSSQRNSQSFFDSGRPPLAGEGVVRQPSTSPDPTTFGAFVVGPVVEAAPLQQVLQRRPRAEPSRVATFQRLLRKSGFLRGSAVEMSGCVKTSTSRL